MLPLLVLAAADAIVMDGDFNDWDNVTNTMCVDAFDAAAGGPDLGTTKWTANGDTLHLWLELCAKDGPMLIFRYLFQVGKVNFPKFSLRWRNQFVKVVWNVGEDWPPLWQC